MKITQKMEVSRFYRICYKFLQFPCIFGIRIDFLKTVFTYCYRCIRSVVTSYTMKLIGLIASNVLHHDKPMCHRYLYQFSLQSSNFTTFQSFFNDDDNINFVNSSQLCYIPKESHFTIVSKYDTLILYNHVCGVPKLIHKMQAYQRAPVTPKYTAG